MLILVGIVQAWGARYSQVLGGGNAEQESLCRDDVWCSCLNNNFLIFVGIVQDWCARYSQVLGGGKAE